MRVDIAWWDLDGSRQTIESLREYLRDGAVGPWAEVPGLRLKFWMADRDHNRWGAVMLWESDRPADRPLPPNRAVELIGYPPTHRCGSTWKPRSRVCTRFLPSTAPAPRSSPKARPQHSSREHPCTST